MRMPVLSEWSLTSEISVITFSLTRSAIFLITPDVAALLHAVGQLASR